MSSYVSSSSTGATPNLQEVKRLNAKDLNGFLKKNLSDIDNHIDTLTAEEVDGSVFFDLTHEALKAFGVSLKASIKIVKLIRDIQGAQPVAVQQSLPLQDEDAEVVDAEVVVKPSVANEPSLSTSKSIPKDKYLPENASQLLRHYELWNKPYDKWPSLHEYSECLHGIKKDRVHGSFKIEIEILKKILSKDDPAQLRLAHLEGQLKMQQTPRNMKKIRRRKVSQLAKLFAKKDVIKEEVEIAQDAIVLGGYRRISQHYNDFHEASAQLVKRRLLGGNDEDLKDKEVVGKSPITKKMKRVIMNYELN